MAEDFSKLVVTANNAYTVEGLPHKNLSNQETCGHDN